ncbi:hypothetical protein [Nocardioides sp. zg-DK7169]|uniref:hypothetical protein n=1 Tax=Nocardioides sp. zg-DK7169 TaxID=2736600 RepID=UPI0015566352|nr:hypothetical protein [Nocardioides sp. zg-DK7169]NPC98948.1 hypothetical protein [Nocardioides sp. zg-DK7169]
MSTPVRIGAFVAALAAVFALALGVGTAVGPWETEEPDGHGHAVDAAGHDDHEAKDDRAGSSQAGAEAEVAGLAVSAGGHTLELVDPVTRSGRQRLAFTVSDADGEPVTAYDEAHERDLHLIVVRRDLTGFQHVHPRLRADGTWTVPVDLSAGAWRVLADFTPAGGDPLVLGADLLVGGADEPERLGPDARTAEVDGYEVTLHGTPEVGAETPLELTVSRDGEPVRDLQPYLGAHGHLVVLRDGDLGYLHAHPAKDGAGAAGPDITFHTTFPSAGRYRLFLDFKHADVVRTAVLTVTVGEEGGPDGSQQPHDGPDHQSDHGH